MLCRLRPSGSNFSALGKLCAVFVLLTAGGAAANDAAPEKGEQIKGEQAKGEQVVVRAPYLNMYTGPGRGYPIFHVVEYGESLWLLKRRTDWVKVGSRRGHQGWVRVEDLQDIEDPRGEPVMVPSLDYDSYRAKRFRLGFSHGDFGGADAVGVSLGYGFTANLSVEMRLSHGVGAFSDSRTYQVALLHQPFPQWRVSPYFALGTGINVTSPNATIVATEDRRDTALLAGFGAMSYLSRRLVLRAEVANHYLLTSRESNQEIIEWKLGLDFFM